MTTIETLNNGDSGLNFRTKLNDNFEALNVDKLEAADIVNKQNILAEGAFVDGDKTKLNNIEAGAEANTLNDVVAGINITIDKSDPLNPIISSTGGGGTGDVVGPASSIDSALPLYDGVSGKLLKDSGKTITTTLGGDNTTIPTSKAVADAIGGAGGGDMLASTYDPQAIEADAFDMDNMVEGVDSKIMTTSERAAIATNTIDIGNKQNVLVSGANIKTVNGDTILGTGDLIVSSGSGGYAGDLYLTNDASVTELTYNQLSYTPDAVEVIETVVTNGEELAQTYLFDLELGTTIIDAGRWIADFYATVDNNTGESTIRIEGFVKASGGTETTLFSASSGELTTTLGYVEWNSTQGVFNVNETDQLGLRVYCATTSAASRTISFYVGGNNSSYITTPLATRHSQLRGRELEDQHPIGAITGLQTELDSKVESDIIGVTGADRVENIISLTQAEYDAIAVPDASTIYNITDSGTPISLVDLTTAQTVGGVKTFTDSPIVPTPIADLQVATKKYVDDNTGGGGSAGLVYITMGATQNIAQNTDTLINFDTKQSDPNNEYNSSSRRFVADTGGTYAINLSNRWQIADNRTIYIYLKVNGVTVRTDRRYTSGNNYRSLQSNFLVALNATDYVEIFCRQDGAAADLYPFAGDHYLNISKI